MSRSHNFNAVPSTNIYKLCDPPRCLHRQNHGNMSSCPHGELFVNFDWGNSHFLSTIILRKFKPHNYLLIRSRSLEQPHYIFLLVAFGLGISLVNKKNKQRRWMVKWRVECIFYFSRQAMGLFQQIWTSGLRIKYQQTRLRNKFWDQIYEEERHSPCRSTRLWGCIWFWLTRQPVGMAESLICSQLHLSLLICKHTHPKTRFSRHVRS